MRITSEKEMHKLVKKVKKMDKVFRKYPDIEMGIVFHFARTRGEESEQGYPKPRWLLSHDDPGAGSDERSKLNPSGYRYETYYTTIRKEASALADMLRSYPRMLEVVRGVDLCTDELGVPLWVLKPLVEHVLDAGRFASDQLGKSGIPVRPLHLSIHAGEDFVHLLGGIRRIGEAVEYLRMGEGDRIGHAVALGVDVAEWAERSNGLHVTRGERLLDLLWAGRAAMTGNGSALRASLSRIIEQATRLADEIFVGEAVGGAPYQVSDLHKLVSCLYRGAELARAGFPSGPAPHDSTMGGSRARQLLDDWLRNREVFYRAQESVPVEVSEDIDFVAELQKQVLDTLARRGVVIEINPSSNLLIGQLGDLANHPLWRISPPRPAGDHVSQVRVCIASDDPITFATRLPDEYQILADTLLESGLRPEEVDAWLERARHAGLDARFTVPRSNHRLDQILVSSPPPLLVP
ncbi:MAG: hypothetical protein V2B18_13800 [Pseudomonadota bacterium]